MVSESAGWSWTRLMFTWACNTCAAKSLLIGLVPQTHFRLQNGAGVQIHRMLRFVNHIDGARLGRPNLGVRIMRVFPIVVAHLFGPLAIKLPHGGGILRIHPVFARQPPDILPIRFLSIAVDQTFEGRVRFDHRSVNAHIPPFDSSPCCCKRGEDQEKDLLISVLA